MTNKHDSCMIALRKRFKADELPKLQKVQNDVQMQEASSDEPDANLSKAEVHQAMAKYLTAAKAKCMARIVKVWPQFADKVERLKEPDSVWISSDEEEDEAEEVEAKDDESSKSQQQRAAPNPR